jgi:hypothetical protein
MCENCTCKKSDIDKAIVFLWRNIEKLTDEQLFDLKNLIAEAS